MIHPSSILSKLRYFHILNYAGIPFTADSTADEMSKNVSEILSNSFLSDLHVMTAI